MKSLSLKICLISLIIVFICFASIGLYSVTKADSALQKEMSKNISDSMHNIAVSIETFNDEEFKMLNTLASLKDIRNPNIDLLEKTHIIYDAMAMNPDYIDVCILDKNGNAWINNGVKMVSFAERNYFKEPFRTGQNFHTDPFINKVTSSPAIFYSVPVFDFDNNIINVIFCVIDGVKLSKEVTLQKIGNERPAFLITLNKTKSGEEEVYSELHSEGTIIANIGFLVENLDYNTYAVDSLFEKAKMTGNQEYVSKLQSIKTDESGLFIQNLFGNDYIVAFERIPGSNWAVVNSLPFADFQGDISNLKFSIASFIILFSIVITAILWVVVSFYIRPLKKVKIAINDIATGSADLTKRLDNKSKDEVGSVVKGFNAFSEKLQDIIKDIKNSESNLTSVSDDLENKTDKTCKSIANIKGNIEDVKTEINNQTEFVNKTVEAVNMVSSNITSLDEMIESQAAGVTQASAAIEEMLSNIASVNKTAEQMSKSFDTLLAESSKGISVQKELNDKISEIEDQSKILQEANKIIKDIAGQTNLLAMNAAIEAAHAGSAGAGFAVVADEIRKLAESSTKEAGRIDKQLKEISNLIGTVVESSNESFQVLQSISTATENTNNLAKQVTFAMEEQNAGSQQVGQTLKSMNDTTSRVKIAGQGMNSNNNVILSEIKNLQNATNKMNESVQKLFTGADEINAAGGDLASIIPAIKQSIKDVSKQIDQFIV